MGTSLGVSLGVPSQTVKIVTYYVNATSGSDSDDGLTIDTAWQTIAKVNAASFSAADIVAFKRGELWREQLTVPSSGVAGAYIDIDAYGSGEDPIISGADLVTTWTVAVNNVYSASVAWSPNIVAEDGALLGQIAWDTDIATTEPTMSAGTWSYDSGNNLLYVWSSDGADPDTHEMAVGRRTYCILIDQKQYVSVRNIRVEYANNSGLRLLNAQANGFCTIDNVTAYGNRITGISCWSGHDNNTIQNCTAQYNGAGFYSWQSDNNTFFNCTEDNSIGYTISPTSDGVGVGLYQSDDAIVANNTLHSNEAAGIQIDGGNGWTLSRNMVRDNLSYGIEIANVNGNDNYLVYNICDSNWNANGYGIGIFGGNGTSTFYLYNNTVYNSAASGKGIYCDTGDFTMRNNLVQNLASGRVLIKLTANITGYDGDNNQFYNGAGGNIFHWNGTDYTNLTDFRAASSEGANTISSNPLMTDPANNDFTLQSGSPCRNVGTDVSLTTDYAGVTVPQETNPAIGAYEYIG